MSRINSNRNYLITDAGLCLFVSHFHSILLRDQADLLEFGITADKIADLKALGDEFERIPQDTFYAADVMTATEEKNEKEVALKSTMLKMGRRVALKWGEKSSKYERFGITGINKFSYAQLLSSARAAISFLNEMKSELAETGLTQQMIDDFEEICNDFENAKNKQTELNELRIIKTAERISKGNALFKIVSNYCSIGKTLYGKTEPAKYNDYLIYRKKRRKKDKAEADLNDAVSD